MKAIDYTGKKIGMLTVIKRADEKLPGVGNVCWECKCDCGNTIVRSSHVLGLKKGVRSCGCYDYHTPLRKDITGQRFGNLVAIKHLGKGTKETGAIWLFQCDCGNTVEKRQAEVTTGMNPTKSCGCSKAWFIGNTEHGHKYYGNLEQNYKFGTNLQAIRVPDTQLCKNNTSGYTGVSYIPTRNCYVAAMRFQGALVQKSCKTLEDAIAARKEMRKARDEFLAWYDSMTEEEQEIAAREYEHNQSMFKDFYKRRMIQIREEKLKDGRYKENYEWRNDLNE